jgi:hypothetical protein
LSEKSGALIVQHLDNQFDGIKKVNECENMALTAASQ